MAKEPIYKGKDRNGLSVWYVQVYTGVRINGKYQRVTEYVHGTKREASRRMREIIIDIEQGINVNGGKTPFDEYANKWLEDKAESIAPRTLQGYTREVNRLCGILGNTPLDRITPQTARDVLKALRSQIQGRDGKPSETTIKTPYLVLNGIMGRAERDELIRRNPCARIDPPKVAQGERRSMTKGQYLSLLEKLLESIQEETAAFDRKEMHLKQTGHQNKQRNEIRGVHVLSYLNAVTVLHATGIRPSELLALQWKHVDFTAGCIHIEQATATYKGGTKSTKTKAGKRDVYLSQQTLDRLKEWRIFQLSAANKLGIELGSTAWVICTDAFTQVQHRNLSRWWRKWSEEKGFCGWDLYELRHTQVTLLLDAGASVKTVQTRLGHSSAAVTLGVYAHALESSQREAANLLPSIA